MIAIPPPPRSADRRRRQRVPSRPRFWPLLGAAAALALVLALLLNQDWRELWMLAGLGLLLVLALALAAERRARRRAEREARRDALTGLLNRRGLDEALLAALTLPAGALSLLILDLDHFKRVNDRFGHVTGDAVLRGVAAALSANLRAQDVLGRWGGEEFVVLLPGVDAQAAGVVAERLRTRLAAEVALHGQPVTVSVGVAGARAQDSASSLLARADAALYAAKRAGRNRTVVDGEPELSQAVCWN